MAVTEATSMVSNEEATAYFDGRLWTEAWDAADTTTKDKALVMATRHLNSLMFQGVPAAADQPHAFPRSYTAGPVMNAGTRFHPTSYFTEEGVPLAIQHATCEQALFLLNQTAYERDRTRHMAAGVSSIGIGGASEQFTANGMAQARHGDVTSPDAMRLMKAYLTTVGDLA